MKHPAMRRHVIGLLSALAILLLPAVARGDPWFGWGENGAEDRYADGDLDEEDHIAMHAGGGVGATDTHGESWLSIATFSRRLASGKNDLGGLVVLGLAFDRWGAGARRATPDPLPQPGASPLSQQAPPPARAESPPPVLAMAPALAHGCVAAAWRASGLGVDDDRIDDLESRSRASAWLPETRARAVRLLTDTAHTTTLTSADGTSYYDAFGANLTLELRLTWRFDRLLYAGDEASLERVRLERQEARSRLAARTLEALFAWERAAVDARQAIPGSHEELEAVLRGSEATATLDVLTGGWFSEEERRRSESPP
jgi:hypothetical protein